MSRYHSPADYLRAARSPDTPPDELDVLAASEHIFVRHAVAQNPNAAPRTLTFLVPGDLSQSNEQQTALLLAQNSKTPPEALGELARRLIPFLDRARGHDSAMASGVALCCHERAPIEALREMLGSAKSREARKRAARETSRRDVLEFLARDRSELVARRARARLEELGEVIKNPSE